MRGPVLLLMVMVAALLAASVDARAQSEPAEGSGSSAPPGEGSGSSAETRPVLSLDEAVTTARDHQPELRRAQADVAAAQARSDQSRAPLLPQLRASAGYQLSAQNAAQVTSFSSTTPSDGGADFTSHYSFGVSVSQLLWDFGGTMDQRRAARALAHAQSDTAASTGLDVVHSARLAYFTAGAARALVDVAQETLDNQQRHLEQIEGYVSVDLRPEIDLAQARAQVANARVALLQAENGYELARVQLNQAMGVETGIDYDVDSTAGLAAIAGEDADSQALVDEAMRERPDVSALDNQLVAQQLDVDAARSAYWPSLSLSSGFTESGTSLDQLNWGWFIGVTLDWRFYQGGLVGAQVRQSEAQLDGLEAQRDLLEQSVRVDVQQAQLSVHSGVAVVAAAGDAVDNAREQLRLAEGRYETGAGSALELNDAQLAVTNALLQQVQAELDLATARATLLAALGRD
jgi:outer membrane protein